MMNIPKVSIVVLNWNSWKDTIECLESLFKMDYKNYEIILVDNGSKDDSLNRIKAYCNGKISVLSPFFEYDQSNKPIEFIEYTEYDIEKIISGHSDYIKNSSNNGLIIIKNGSNYGFAEGNNIAIRYLVKTSNPDYIFLLNNDTVVDRNFLIELVKAAESDKKIAILGAKICYYNFKGRKDILFYTHGKINWFRYPGYVECGNHLIDSSENSVGIIECDYISGAAMMIRVKDNPLIFLNNKFFFGDEDVDLCIRTKKYGFKIVSVLSSRIWHKIGSSRKKRYREFFRGEIEDTITNLRFIKLHNRYFFFFLALYIPQIILYYSFLFLRVIFGNIYKITNEE